MSISVEHEITPFDIAFALAGMDDDGLRGFAEELADDMDNQADDMLAKFIDMLAARRDALREEQA